MQPHYPYIGLVSQGVKPVRGPVDRVKGFVRWNVFVKLLGRKYGLRIASKILGNPPNELSLLAKRIGIEGLRKAYEENLRLVLSYVAKILRYLKGKVVITSDHGELLGEKRLFGHSSSLREPELLEVPWFKVEV